LHAISKSSRLEDDTLECQHELTLRRGSHVKAIEDTIIAEVSNNRVNEQWRVVAVIKASRAGKKIQIPGAVLIAKVRTLRVGEHRWPSPAIVTYFGLEVIEDIHVPPAELGADVLILLVLAFRGNG
jgi:hypothetical protein